MVDDRLSVDDEDDDDEPVTKRPMSRAKRERLYLILVAVSFLLIAVGAFVYTMWPTWFKQIAEIPDEQKPITVLIVGNDTLHTNDVPNMLREVSRMSKSWRPVEVTAIALEDYSLGQHITEKKAEELIKQEPWTFVVLQDRWLQPLQDPAGMLDSARALTDTARKQGSKVVLFIPWADAGDEKRQEVLSAVSRKLAERLSIDVAPAGDVFFAVAKKHKDLNLYVGDNHHVSAIGSWLAAATLYSVITNQKPKLFADKFTYNGDSENEPHVPIVGDQAIDIETMVWQTVNDENKGRKLGPPVVNAVPQGMGLQR